MTITSNENFGHGNTPVSLSELRDFYGKSNPVSLNATFNGGQSVVPDSLPAAGTETSFGDFRNAYRVLRKKGTTQTIASGTSWTPAQADCVQYNVYVVGGGGGGSVVAGTGGAQGGCGGGTALGIYTSSTDNITSAIISIGAGGASRSRTTTGDGGAEALTGNSGGSTVFNPNGDGPTLTGGAGAGGRGVTSGTVSATAGGTATGGDSNFAGNGQAATSGKTIGAGPNLGSGGSTKPTEWGTDVTASFAVGSPAAEYFDGANIVYTAGSASPYGAGGAAARRYPSGDASFVITSGSGSQGAIFVTYYELNS